MLGLLLVLLQCSSKTNSSIALVIQTWVSWGTVRLALKTFFVDIINAAPSNCNLILRTGCSYTLSYCTVKYGYGIQDSDAHAHMLLLPPQSPNRHLTLVMLLFQAVVACSKENKFVFSESGKSSLESSPTSILEPAQNN